MKTDEFADPSQEIKWAVFSVVSKRLQNNIVLGALKESLQKGNRVLGRCKKDLRLKSDETQQHLIHENMMSKSTFSKSTIGLFNSMIPQKQ